MMLSAEQYRALEMLADAGSRGSILDMLIANGFPAEMLADLVRDGLATMQGETVKVAYRSGPCPVWIKIRNPASIAVQRERSENWNR